MKLLVTAGLSDYKLSTKLIGALHSTTITEIILVRRKPLLGPKKISNVCPSGIWARFLLSYEVWRLWTMYRLARHDSVVCVWGIQLVLHGVQAALTGWLARKPCLLSVIGDDIHIHFHDWWKRSILCWATRRAVAIVVLGPKSMETLVMAGVQYDRLIKLQNYQDAERFYPIEQEREWDLVFVGDLIKRKRVDVLLRAVAEVSARIPGIRVVIVGDGVEKGSLEQLARKLGIDKLVDFLGRRGDVEDILNRSRAFILVSRIEAVPAAAIEAMYCGLPCILTDICDVRAVFNDDNSLLVPLEEYNVLVSSIITLLSNENTYTRLRQGALESRAIHAAKWGMDGQVKGWEALLNMVLNRAGTTS